MTIPEIEIFDRFRETVLAELKKRKEAGELQAVKLADTSGLSVQSIYSLASGTRGRQPEFITIFRLALAMGWTVEDVIAELFPDRAISVGRLVRERPKVLDHLAVILENAKAEDLDKLEADLEYMATKLAL